MRIKSKEIRIDALWISIFLIIIIVALFSYLILNMQIKEKKRFEEIMHLNRSNIFVCDKIYKISNNKIYHEYKGDWLLYTKLARKNQDLFKAERRYYDSHVGDEKCITDVFIFNYEDTANGLKVSSAPMKEIVVKNCQQKFKSYKEFYRRDKKNRT